MLLSHIGTRLAMLSKLNEPDLNSSAELNSCACIGRPTGALGQATCCCTSLQVARLIIHAAYSSSSSHPPRPSSP
jgi:hypothetical protein